MKHLKVILLAFTVMAAFTGIVIFSACSKNDCGSIVCQNGGTCSGGKCTCPTGFFGTRCQGRNTTGISYKNNSFTPITISVNGNTQTIPVGGSVTFTGGNGIAATGTATTSGGSSLGISSPNGVIGMEIDWQINNIFPSSDTLRVPLDVGSSYFFLRMTNKGAKNIINYYVNVGFPSTEEFFQDVTVPNDGKTYDLGYYLAYSSSNVQTQSADSKIVWKAVTLPLTNNQSFTVTIP
jgi:hypothetical protein